MSYDESTDHSSERRALLRGLALFLGAGSFGLVATVSLSGCSSERPEVLSALSGAARELESAWRPPNAMLTLGEAILKTHPKLTPHIERFSIELTALTKELSKSPSELESSLAQHLKNLHRASTRRGEWIDVRGWRLSRVEASAYALIALSQ